MEAEGDELAAVEVRGGGDTGAGGSDKLRGNGDASREGKARKRKQRGGNVRRLLRHKQQTTEGGASYSSQP